MRQPFIPSQAVATTVERTEEGTMIVHMGPQHPSEHVEVSLGSGLEREIMVHADYGDWEVQTR